MKKIVFAVSVFVSTLVASLGIAQAQTNIIVSIKPTPAVQVSVQGVPGTAYTLQSTTNLADPNAWQYVVTFEGSSNGEYNYDAFANGPGTDYRAVAVAPGITTLGVQGILSVTQGPISDSLARAGQTKVPILDIRMQAQYSDLAVQSIELDLGTSTSIYNFVYKNMYLVDPTTSNILATIPLNPTTVVQNGKT